MFRHPLRHEKDGRTGLKVRRGLGTADKGEAERLVAQMNSLLANEALWSRDARDKALNLYDEIIVKAFYDNLVPSVPDYWAMRNSVLPLPCREEGYAMVQLIGTTGAGKTTLVRQVIGTDPTSERFPSTSASRTTIADMEIVLAGAPFRAVVTFLPRHEVRLLIEECVVAAAMAYLDNGNMEEVARKLLGHSDQRFRLSYVLGTLRVPSAKEEELRDDEESAPEETEEPEISPEERAALVERLRGYLNSIQHTADLTRESTRTTLNLSWESSSKEDRDTFLEILEDESKEAFQDLVDQILDDVEGRFSLLQAESIERDLSDWPVSWSFQTSDRSVFIKTINRFSSNYAPNFGRLLTPLVQGIRVAGPFKPAWTDEEGPLLVLMDGEGLGHTADSASSISTAITKRYELADAIVLVDNAAQPMQEAPSEVLRSLVASGHAPKLAICFTHFEEVRGVNLPDMAARQAHVLNARDNIITAIGRDVGQQAGSALKQSLTHRTFFVARIQDPLTAGSRFTREQLRGLIAILESTIAPRLITMVTPVYDDAFLILALQRATREFRDTWRARLELRVDARVSPEHWTRVKALTRRVSAWGVDEYDTLRPVASLIARLAEHISRFLERPIRWEPNDGTEEMRQAAVDNVRRGVHSRLHVVIRERLITARSPQWDEAYAHRGTGSVRVRAVEIDRIFDAGAPLLDDIVGPGAYGLFKAVRDVVRESIESGGGKLDSGVVTT